MRRYDPEHLNHQDQELFNLLPYTKHIREIDKEWKAFMAYVDEHALHGKNVSNLNSDYYNHFYTCYGALDQLDRLRLFTLQDIGSIINELNQNEIRGNVLEKIRNYTNECKKDGKDIDELHLLRLTYNNEDLMNYGCIVFEGKVELVELFPRNKKGEFEYLKPNKEVKRKLDYVYWRKENPRDKYGKIIEDKDGKTYTDYEIKVMFDNEPKYLVIKHEGKEYKYGTK